MNRNHRGRVKGNTEKKNGGERGEKKAGRLMWFTPEAQRVGVGEGCYLKVTIVGDKKKKAREEKKDTRKILVVGEKTSGKRVGVGGEKQEPKKNHPDRGAMEKRYNVG